MGGGTDIGVSVRAGVVVEDESDFAFAHGFFCKGDPFFHPDGNFPATVRERLAGFFAIRTTAAGTDMTGSIVLSNSGIATAQPV